MAGLFWAIAAVAAQASHPPTVTISAAEVAGAPRLTITREPVWRISDLTSSALGISLVPCGKR
ncbi:MAG TPA: hypothetical protein VJ717_17325 [Gemmatimonadaceae bacterium]|nr:hypothetical protein [Gemmatimonadaceae bacterium]